MKGLRSPILHGFDLGARRGASSGGVALDGKPNRQAFLDFLRRKLEEAERGGAAGREQVPEEPPPEAPEEPPLHEMERLLNRVLRKRGYAAD